MRGPNEGRSGTLGIVGTLVWDRVVPADGGAVVEGWGGIAYGLAAAVAALPAGWRVRPIVKVGDDLAAEAVELLSSMSLHAASVVRTPEATNRVALRYHDASERTERLSGGVPGWRAPELAERVDGCDALLVNFISGFELPLDVASTLPRTFGGPIYADLHSLFLGVATDGTRVARPLAGWRDWCACFDAVQMNEREFDLLAPTLSEAERIDAILETGCRLVAVTRGGRGVRLAHAEAEGGDCRSWPAGRGRGSRPVGARTVVRDVTLPSERRGDPTGCGDVWGGAMFARLLAGDSVADAARTANRLAARSVERVGVTGLLEALGAEVAAEGGANINGEVGS